MMIYIHLKHLKINNLFLKLETYKIKILKFCSEKVTLVGNKLNKTSRDIHKNILIYHIFLKL